MIGAARTRASSLYPGLPANFLVGSAEATGLADAGFDLIVGSMVLHHLQTAQAAPEIARLLKPGGRGLFVENSGLNPVLRFARAHVAGRFGIPRLGTIDEHPLVSADFDEYGRYFSDLALKVRAFRFFGLISRQVLRYRFVLAGHALKAMDSTVDRYLPPFRRYSYHLLVVLKR